MFDHFGNNPNFTKFDILDKPAISFFFEGIYISPSNLHCIFYAFLAILTILTVTAVFIVSLFARSFHKNLKLLHLCGVAVWFELGISKLLVLIAQRNYFDIQNHAFNTEGSNLLLAAAYLRYHFDNFFVTTPLTIIIERGFATYYVEDYERFTRFWIFIILFGFNFSSAMLLSYLTVNGVIKILTFTILISSLNIAILSGLSFLLFSNGRRYDFLEKDHRKTIYTLSIKYQVRENLAILESLKCILIVVSVAIFLVLSAFVVPAILKFNSENMWLTTIFVDVMYHFNPLYMGPACLLCMNHNRELVKKFFRGRKLRKPEKSGPFILPNEGDVYFQMFQKTVGRNPSLHH